VTATPSLDVWMPEYVVRSAHQIDVRAAPEVVYRTLRATDFGRNPVVIVLMAVRGIPALLRSPRRAFAVWRGARRRPKAQVTGSLLAGHFTLLAEQPPSDITFGLTGRFWTLTGQLAPTERAGFRDPLPAGLARAAWTLHVEPLGPARTRLSTETRVACADDETRRSFRRYWRLISVGSGVIRMALLRQVKREAERHHEKAMSTP